MKWGGMLFASLLMASSCQNEEVVQNQSAQGQAFTLTASKGMGSRTAIDGDKTVWSEGDKIYVSSKDGKVTGVLTLTDGADDVTGTFSGFVFGNPNQLAYSVYPAPTSGTTLDLSEVAGAHQLDAPMIGKINQDGDVDVQFNHACGVLYVNLPGSTGQDFTITATNGGTAIYLAATANVSASSIQWNGEVPSLKFTSPETDIEVTDAKGGIMYIPYYTNEANLTNVTFKVENTVLNITPINLTQYNGPIGKIVQSNILTLTYDNGEYKATTVPEVEAANNAVIVSAEDLGENIEYINIPIVKDENGQVVEVESITVELPKFDEQGQTSVISFDEIAEGTAVTIKEDEDASEEHSIKELTVILPSADAPVKIDMPNTTVTIISADSNELVIEEIIVGTADDTFVVEENVYIKTLKVRKGNVEVKGRVDNIIREGYEEGDADIYVYIIGNGKVGSIGEGVKYANKANGEVSTAEDLIAALDINEGDKATITLNADITLNETAIVKEGTNVTLDLNGKTITIQDKNAIRNDGGILTIKNGTVTRTGDIVGYSVNNASGEITVENATINRGLYTSGNKFTAIDASISHEQSNRHAIYAYNCEVTINSGIYHNDNAGNATLMATGSSIVTIKGGTFSIADGSSTFGWTSCLIDQNSTAKVVVKGGTFNGGFRINSDKTELTIEGGSFNTSNGSAYTDYSGTKVVKGGTFTDKNAQDWAKKYLAGGYIMTAEGEVVFAPVAKVGLDNYFTTLQKAVNAVQDGETITLVANETFTEQNHYDNGGYWDGLGYSGDKSFTIDLGGYTISQDGALNDYLMWFKNDGSKDNTITLKNGTLDAGTTAYSAFATASSNAKKITINLEDINLFNNNSNGAVVKARGGSELNVKAGTIITALDSYTGIEAAGTNTVVNIYEGAEIYQKGTSSYVGAIVGASQNATLNIFGGKGKSAKCGIIVMSTGATINVSGGEWIANNDGTVAGGNQGVLVSQNNRNESGWACKSVMNVTGGTFKGGYDCWGMGPGVEADDAQINIKGGNFNADPTQYVVAGYEVTGNYTVAKPQALVALEEAIAKGGNVTLANDVTLLESLKIENTVVLDLNGKTITAPLFSAFEVKPGGDLTLKNGQVVAYESTVRAIGGKAVIESGEYTSTGTAAGSPATNRYSLDCREGGELVINGGTFKSNNGMINVGSTVTINGGKFENIVEQAKTRHFAYVSAPLTINNGEFYGKANSSAGGCFFCGAAAGGEITVNGGKFTSLWTSGSINNIFESYYGGTITVTGGMFNTNGGIDTFVTENTDEATKAAYPYVAK